MSNPSKPHSLATRLTSSVAVGIAGAALVSTALLLLVNMGSRWLLGSAITGTVELSGLLLVVLLSFAIVHSELASGHIAMTFVVERLPAAVRRVVEALTVTATAAVTFVVVYALFRAALTAYERGQVHSMTLPWPLWPFRGLLALGMLMLGLVMLRKFRRLVRPLDVSGPQ
jgi:TRAP-type C4-dicarboxylate transport system permease small subunit